MALCGAVYRTGVKGSNCFLDQPASPRDQHPRHKQKQQYPCESAIFSSNVEPNCWREKYYKEHGWYGDNKTVLQSFKEQIIRPVEDNDDVVQGEGGRQSNRTNADLLQSFEHIYHGQV